MGNTVRRIIRMSPDIRQVLLSGYIRMNPDLGRIIRFIVLTDNPLIRSNKFVG